MTLSNLINNNNNKNTVKTNKLYEMECTATSRSPPPFSSPICCSGISRYIPNVLCTEKSASETLSIRVLTLFNTL